MNMENKYKLEKVNELPASRRKSGILRELIENFLTSGYAFSKVIGMRPTGATGLRNAAIELHLDKKVAINVRSGEVYISKIYK